jgi:hypothetical protein
MFGTQKRASKIDRERTVPVFEAYILNKGGWSGYTSIVDQDIYSAETSKRRRHNVLDVGFDGDVGMDRNRPSAAAEDFLFDGLDFLFGWTGQNNRCTFQTEPKRDGPSDPPAAPGYDCHLSIEFHSKLLFFNLCTTCGDFAAVIIAD